MVALSDAQDLKPIARLSVCELLKQPSKFNGRVIELRGIYFVGGHGLYLAGAGCEAALVTKDKRWEPMIWVENSREKTESRGLNFERVKKTELEIATAKFREMSRRGVWANKISQVIVTYLCIFETHDSFDTMIGALADDIPVPIGFGDQGVAPGQIFIDSVKDIVVKFEGD